MPFRNCFGMITSVSMFALGSGTAAPLTMVNASNRQAPFMNSRTSVRCPEMAAAATIAGLIRWVRPPRP